MRIRARRRMREAGRWKMLAEIEKRSCASTAADKETGITTTLLLHFRWPDLVRACLSRLLGGLYAPDRQGILSRDQGQWLRGLPLLQPSAGSHLDLSTAVLLDHVGVTTVTRSGANDHNGWCLE